MEFVKFYKNTDFEYDRNYGTLLVSNFSHTKIFIKDKCLFVNEKVKFHLPERTDNFSLFTITDNFALLYSPEKTYHYVIHISDIITFNKIQGNPTYITKSGYLMFSKGTNGIKITKVIFSDHNVQTVEEYYLKYGTNFFMKGYILYRQRGKKITMYMEKESFMEDFDNVNDIPIKYYFMNEPKTLEISQENILVKFQDIEKVIPAIKLILLKSTFINEQLLNDDIVYLDVEYSEFKHETFEFFAYINSYLLIQSLYDELINTAFDDTFRCKRSSILKHIYFLHNLNQI